MKNRIGRIIVLAILFVSTCVLFCLRLVKLQLIDGEMYLAQSQNRVITKTIVKAPRGEILDRYCRPIVKNQKVFTVGFNTTLVENLNNTILETVNIFEDCGQEYIDTFPISKTKPYVYDELILSSESSIKKFESYLSSKKASTTQTAEQSVNALIKYYKLNSYTPEEARKIIAVRYEMEIRTDRSFFVFASDINIETASSIKENSDTLKGVYIEVEPVRYYTEDYFASHIIGQVGRIYASEYETLKTQGYSLDDMVGKDGIEKVAESYLRGINGYKYAVRDITGTTTEIIENVEPQKGNDIILTLDMNMQIITENSLAEVVDALKILNGEEAANSGAAVFMDVHTGEILASASYPTYNLATYNKDFATLSKDESKPFLNRVISGSFPPGSTFKMIAALAGLQESVVNINTVYNCTGVYTFYNDYHPTCFGSTAHGKTNVYDALKKSCNTYFFDVGRMLGIDTLNSYAKMFGFGQKTGIELLNESKGILAGREYRESRGLNWQEGETLLAAIGQTDNAATPIQLVNYIATIANNGTRLVPHIIKSVRNSENGEIIQETLPVVAEALDLSQKNIDAVMKGIEMAAMERGGSAYSGFSDFTLSTVAIKTGTSEMPNGLPSSLMVGYAPAQNPQIAFAVVIENGGTSSSSTLAILVKNVLSYYFSNLDSSDKIYPEAELIP